MRKNIITSMLVLFTLFAPLYSGQLQGMQVRMANLPTAGFGSLLLMANDTKYITALKDFLLRIKNAGYTHVRIPIIVDDSTQWDDGVYVYKVRGLQDNLRSVDSLCKLYDLKIVPIITCGNNRTEMYRFVNNDSIRYEPMITENIMNRLIDKVRADGDKSWDVDQETTIKAKLKVQVANAEPPANGITNGGIMGDYSDFITVSNCVIYGHTVDDTSGFGKTFRSILRDIVLPACGDSLEYIHIGMDEPVNYSPNAPNPFKLLIGHSQPDLRWIYEHAPDSGGVHKIVYPAGFGFKEMILSEMINGMSYTWDSTFDEATNDSLAALMDSLADENDSTLNDRVEKLSELISAYTDNYYFVNYSDPDTMELFMEGVRMLYADFIKERVQDMKRILPNTKMLMYADMLDPQHSGGYLNTADALGILSNSTYSTGSGTHQLKSELILMPWQHRNTYTPLLETEITDAVMYGHETIVEATVDIIKDLCKEGCSGYKTKFGRGLCRAGCYLTLGPAAFVLVTAPLSTGEPLTTIGMIVGRIALNDEIHSTIYSVPDSLVISLDLNNLGHKYDNLATCKFFIQHGFHFINDFGIDMGYPYMGSLSMSRIYEYADAVNKLNSSERNFALGYDVSAWADIGEQWVADAVHGGYNQSMIMDAFEVSSIAYGTTTTGNRRAFTLNSPLDTLSIFADSTTTNEVDYYSVNENCFDKGWRSGALLNPRTEVQLTDIIIYCNNMSRLEGLDTAYNFSYVPRYDWESPNWLIYDSLRVSLDTNSAGYRLPTLRELVFLYSNQASLGLKLDSIEWAQDTSVSFNAKPYNLKNRSWATTGVKAAFRLVRNYPGYVTVTGAVPKTKLVVARKQLNIYNLQINAADGFQGKAGDVIIIDPEFEAKDGSEVNLYVK